MAKKKILTLFTATTMAALMTISMTACGDPTNPTDKDPEVSKIEITTAPTKTHYVLGDKFDTTGMVVSKVYDNNEKEAIPATEYTYSPNAALKLNDKKVTISWEDFKVDQKISVTNDIASVTVTAPPAKTEYVTGELFDPTGMKIKATLENGDEEEEIAVTADVVEYNTQKLTAGDSHFKMIYGGCEFYYDMTVKCGAFMEAEAGLIVSSGVKVGDAPNKVAIEADLDNAYCVNGEGTPSVRGIDKGLKKTVNGVEYTIEQRVDIRNYIFDPADKEYTYEDFCATGGGNHSSFVSHSNIMEFDRSGNGSILYALTADKAGKVNLTLRMTVSDPDNSAIAPETKLSEVMEITVNGTKITIPDSSKLNTVDFSAKKSYVPGTEVSSFGDYKGTFTGKAPRTQYYWQNVTVPITTVAGPNSIIVKSIMTQEKNGKRNMFLDSVSFDGDADKVSLFNESAFAPEIKSAKLKVEDEKVYMGVIVDPKSVGYDESAVLTVLGLTKVKSSGCCSWQNNGDGNVNTGGSGEKNDPWTSPTSYGGLGYTEAPLLMTSGKGGDWKDEINKREVSVEKITDGDYKDLYCVWLEVTTPDDPKGPTPDTNRFVGAVYFSGFTYGSDYANVHPTSDILKTGDSTCVESGDYCYQVFCDTRDKYACFYAGNEINIILVVQNGTFDSAKATETLPLRNKLMRRWNHLADQDQELVDLRKPTEPAA